MAGRLGRRRSGAGEEEETESENLRGAGTAAADVVGTGRRHGSCLGAGCAPSGRKGVLSPPGAPGRPPSLPRRRAELRLEGGGRSGGVGAAGPGGGDRAAGRSPSGDPGAGRGDPVRPGGSAEVRPRPPRPAQSRGPPALWGEQQRLSQMGEPGLRGKWRPGRQPAAAVSPAPRCAMARASAALHSLADSTEWGFPHSSDQRHPAESSSPPLYRTGCPSS